jgi:hypothetical protein
MPDEDSPITLPGDLPLNADAVVIVVHGLGDNSAREILDESKPAFEGLKVEKIIAHNFPQSGGDMADTKGILISSPNYAHVILPFIWSKIGQRSAQVNLPFSGRNDTNKVAAAMSFLFIQWWYSLRCAFKVKKLHLGVIIGFLSIAWFVAICFIFWGFINLLGYIKNIGDYLQNDNHIILQVFLAVFSGILISFILDRLLPTLDRLGDLTRYVGSNKIRQDLENDLQRFILEVAKRCSNAKILLIGNDLGSILISQVASKISIDEVTSKRIVLLTISSPLRSMSKIFRIVKTPETLLADFNKNGVVQFWANLWRDHDIMGQGLGLNKFETFSEKSIGLGNHHHIWGDSRLWAEVNSILESLQTGAIGDLKNLWIEEMLKEPDKGEIGKLAYMLRQRHISSLCGILIVIIYILHGGLGIWYNNVYPTYQKILWALSIILVILALIIIRLPPRVIMNEDIWFQSKLRLVEFKGRIFWILAHITFFGFLFAVIYAHKYGLINK